MRRKSSPLVTRAEHSRLLKEVTHLRRIVDHNSETIEAFRKDTAANLRRCGELQAEIDALRKLLPRDD
jgi:hypothetical protein